MDYHNITAVKEEYLDDIKENFLKDPKNELIDNYTLTDIKDEYLYDGKENFIEYSKGDKRLRVLTHTSKLQELVNIKEISKPVKYIETPAEFVDQPVYLQKGENKFFEPSLFTLVGDFCSIVNEDKQEEQFPISPSKDPLTNLHITQTEHNFKCSTCQTSFLNSSALTRHTKIHINERKFVCLECNKTFQRPFHLKHCHLRH